MSLDAERSRVLAFKQQNAFLGSNNIRCPHQTESFIAVVSAAGTRSAPIAEVEVGPVGGPCPPRLQARPPDLPVHTPRATGVGNEDEATHH